MHIFSNMLNKLTVSMLGGRVGSGTRGSKHSEQGCAMFHFTLETSAFLTVRYPFTK